MPSNPNKETQKAWRWLDEYLMNKISQEGIHINQLKRIMLINYAISEISLIKRIQDCYIDLGYIENINNILTKKE